MEFKDKLKKMRTENNLTQDALAKILFVSRSAIAKWEAGLGLPASDSLENLCSYFSVSKEELLGNIYREDDLIHRNLTIAKQKRKIVVLSFSTIIFLLLGIIFLGILFGNKENDEFIINESISSTIALKNHINPFNQEEALAGQIEEKVLSSKYGYSYQTITFERIPFTNQSNLILFCIQDNFTPGSIAYYNDSKHFDKNANLDKVDIEFILEENQQIRFLYSWPNYDQGMNRIYSSFGDTIIFDSSLNSNYLNLELIESGLKFYYNERFDSLVLSPDRKEKIVNFYYEREEKRTKWMYDVLNPVKTLSRMSYSYVLLEVKKNTTFDFSLKYSMKTGNKITQKSHKITCES